MQNIDLLAGLLFKTGKYETIAAARAEAQRQVTERQQRAAVADGTLLDKRFEPGRPIGGK